MVNPIDMAGERKRKKERKKNELGCPVSVCCEW